MTGRAQHSAKQLLEKAFSVWWAACHGYLLTSETSCERFNQFPDRSLVIATVGTTGAEFFTDPEIGLSFSSSAKRKWAMLVFSRSVSGGRKEKRRWPESRIARK